MKITSPYFENETYRCNECETNLNENEINSSNWRCSFCNTKIVIFLPDERNPLVRLFPKEMTEYDSVFDQHTREYWDLKGITYKNGTYRIGIKDYGMVTVKENDLINCMWRGQY